MTQKTEALTQLIREVRTCFNQLKSLADALNSDLDITPSLRGVMEGLSGGGSRTVPDLAQERGVSRQHVQTVINSLLERCLVRSEDNPDHKRSVLYVLTENGETLFEEIRKREAAPMVALSEALSLLELAGSTEALSRMNEELKRLISKEKSND